MLGLAAVFLVFGLALVVRVWGETQTHGLLDIPVLAFASLPVWIGLFAASLGMGLEIGTRISGRLASASAVIAWLGAIIAWWLS